MARPLRIDVKDGWYHVSARGIERREIFDGGRDNEHFLELLGRRYCGLSLRELGSAVGGVDYHAVSKALTRMEKRVLSDSRLRSVIDKAEKEMFNDET